MPVIGILPPLLSVATMGPTVVAEPSGARIQEDDTARWTEVDDIRVPEDFEENL